MKRFLSTTVFSIIFLSILMVMGGCSGSGKGGSSTIGSGSTVVSGKVTLSASIVGNGKTQLSKSKFLADVASLRPPIQGAADRPAYLPDYDLLNKLNAASFATALANAQVDMYDADHPEWLFPVSSGSTDSDGNYTLSSMTNASKNSGCDLHGR